MDTSQQPSTLDRSTPIEQVAAWMRERFQEFENEEVEKK